jgi:hypothetical protein
MSDIKKLIEKLDEMTSGCVASVAQPLGATQKRVTETPEASPRVDKASNWGNWGNKSDPKPVSTGVKKSKNKE